ncbi:MAG: methyltransferase [bacterium]|nr:methyltransferase [bacterium]
MKTKHYLRSILNRLRLVFETSEARRHSLVGPAQLWKMKRDFQIAFLKKSGLKQEHALLDLGCGTLRGGIPLIEYLDTGNYMGLDSREKIIEEAKKELLTANLAHKEPILKINTDFQTLLVENKFAYIWAFSVLIHMDDDTLRKCVAFIATHLETNGIFYANVNIGAHQEGKWQGFPIVWRTLEFYRKIAEKNNLTVEDIGPLKELGHHSGSEAQDTQRMLKFKKNSPANEK